MKMLKFLFLMMILSFNALANENIQTADSLFAARDLDETGMKRALEASNIYAAEANSESSLEMKSEYLIKSSESIYFFADNSESKDVKKEYFLKGAQLALDAAALLESNPGKPSMPKDLAQKGRLAQAYYWYGVNKGRWAEANGVLNSLSAWPTVKEYMDFIIDDLKEPQTQFYGANRILGKAYMKLPIPWGSNKESLNYLSEAFEKTIGNDPDGISSYGINCLYYAEILETTGERELAKMILEALVSKGESEESLRQYNPERVPESKKEIKAAKAALILLK